MKTILSVQNPEIQEVSLLIHPKERKRLKKFIIEGVRTLTTFVEAGHKILKLYATEDTVEQAKKLTDITNIVLVNDSVINKISQTSSPSGLVGVFKIPRSPAIESLEAGIVLAQISDPGNMGTLIRTCAAMGKKTVVIVDGADVWSPKVVQSSAGALALVNIFSWSWAELVKNKGNLKLTGLVVTDGKKPEEVDLKNALLVIGSEAHGISEAWLSDCEERVTIPMSGGTESLNAAVAGSIAMYLAWKE